MFIAADIPERYGYKLLSGEKHTVKRDVLLRLSIGAGLGLRDTNRALKLYGLTELYARIPRDAVLIIGIQQGLDVHGMDELLLSHGFEPLLPCGN
ncbi:MAG: hypothetical protein IJ100_09080 [Lachnospiraceae bacterium]|nr:hypothetical protein [Lachnospiraceae bacterium]